VAADPVALAPDPEFAAHLDDFLAAQLSPPTRESYAGDLALFLTWLRARAKHPRDASRPDIDRYRSWLGELVDADGKPAANGRPRYSSSGAARKLSAVRAFYSYLAERRMVPGSPATGVRGPRVRGEPRGRAITDEQVRRLLAVAAERGPEVEAIVCLVVLNGLRASEVCAANVEDLRRESHGGHSLAVRGKGAKEVDVALNERTKCAVLATVGARSQGPLFRRQNGRRLRAGTPAPRVPYNRQAIGRLLRDLADRAGLPGDADIRTAGPHPHNLRHTFVTLLSDRGVPLVAARDAARHASSDKTRLYDRARAAWREHPTHRLDF
jgi:integrase/recombinase XerC